METKLSGKISLSLLTAVLGQKTICLYFPDVLKKPIFDLFLLTRNCELLILRHIFKNVIEIYSEAGWGSCCRSVDEEE